MSTSATLAAAMAKVKLLRKCMAMRLALALHCFFTTSRLRKDVQKNWSWMQALVTMGSRRSVL